MYMRQKFDVFISYRGDSDGGILGSKIYSDLLHLLTVENEKEYVPFFAPACIPKGEDFKTALVNVMEDIKCVILILTKGFFVNCEKDDDIVFFELQSALKNPNIRFIPLIMPDFKFENELQLMTLFNSSDIDRFKHINAINYHSIYDFKTEIDLLPVLRNVLKSKSVDSKQKSQYEYKVNDFTLSKGTVITFGMYPQSVVSDIALIEKIATGMFTGDTILNSNSTLQYNGEIFATFAENPFNKTKFDNGKLISPGARNYYRVEPVKWIELYKNSEYSVFISEKLIDAIPYNLSRLNHRKSDGSSLPANNWEMSYIRRWLNNEFYYDAFNDDERGTIQLSLIDNSPDSSYHTTQNSVDTLDNVFLVSHTEIKDTYKGRAITTDYARARGAYSSTSSSHEGHGDWWTRSPGNVSSSVENIDRRGYINSEPFCNYVDDTAASVRPCIIIKR